MLTKGLDSQLDNTVPANQLRRMRLNILLVVRTQVIKAPYCTWTACNAMFIFIYIHTVHTVYTNAKNCYVHGVNYHTKCSNHM